MKNTRSEKDFEKLRGMHTIGDIIVRAVSGPAVRAAEISEDDSKDTRMSDLLFSVDYHVRYISVRQGHGGCAERQKEMTG